MIVPDFLVGKDHINSSSKVIFRKLTEETQRSKKIFPFFLLLFNTEYFLS